MRDVEFRSHMKSGSNFDRVLSEIEQTPLADQNWPPPLESVSESDIDIRHVTVQEEEKVRTVHR